MAIITTNTKDFAEKRRKRLRVRFDGECTVICYIILHYMVKKTTVECVDALEKHIDLLHDHVIIVDNHSTNGSGRFLERKYRHEPWCTVILNERNEGYARGNNVGYQCAREMGADFIVIMNNDVIIDDPLFSKKIETLYAQTDFDVYGPDILSMMTGKHQNVSLFPLTPEEINENISKLNWFASMSPEEVTRRARKEKYQLLKKTVKRIVEKILGVKDAQTVKTVSFRTERIPEKDYDHPVLHGACLVFSKRFIRQEELAFHPDTFMYCEEWLLNLKCDRNGYRMIYDPVVQVKHYEGQSTKSVFTTYTQIQHLKAVEKTRSLKVLKSVMEEDARSLPYRGL